MMMPLAVSLIAYLVLSSSTLEHNHTKIAMAILFGVWAGVAAALEQQLRGRSTLVRVWPIFTSIAFVFWGGAASLVVFCATAMALKWLLGLNLLFGIAIIGGTFLFRGIGSNIEAVDSAVDSKAATYTSLMEACSTIRLRLARATLEPNLHQRVKLMVDRIATLPRSINIPLAIIILAQDIIRPDGSLENQNLEQVELWVQSIKCR